MAAPATQALCKSLMHKNLCILGDGCGGVSLSFRVHVTLFFTQEFYAPRFSQARRNH